MLPHSSVGSEWLVCLRASVFINTLFISLVKHKNFIGHVTSTDFSVRLYQTLACPTNQSPPSTNFQLQKPFNIGSGVLNDILRYFRSHDNNSHIHRACFLIAQNKTKAKWKETKWTPTKESKKNTHTTQTSECEAILSAKTIAEWARERERASLKRRLKSVTATKCQASKILGFN